MYLALLGLCFLPGESDCYQTSEGDCEDHCLVSESVLSAVCIIHCHFGEAVEQCGKLTGLGTYLSSPFRKLSENDINFKWWF